ncbi:hypothetical protein MKW92_041752 [Papaver armeniacum]|nr:hypothetical protein MKW92_041752 [Papaver armeniacum]
MCGKEYQGPIKIQGQVVSKTAGAVYSPFIDLEANKAANKVVKALVLKVWKFKKKRSGKYLFSSNACTYIPN